MTQRRTAARTRTRGRLQNGLMRTSGGVLGPARTARPRRGQRAGGLGAQVRGYGEMYGVTFRTTTQTWLDVRMRESSPALDVFVPIKCDSRRIALFPLVRGPLLAVCAALDTSIPDAERSLPGSESP